MTELINTLIHVHPWSDHRTYGLNEDIVWALREELAPAILTTQFLTVGGSLGVEVLSQKLFYTGLVYQSSTAGVQDGWSLGTCHCHGTSGVSGAFSGGVCRTGAIESTGCSGRVAGGAEVCEVGTWEDIGAFSLTQHLVMDWWNHTNGGHQVCATYCVVLKCVAFTGFTTTEIYQEQDQEHPETPKDWRKLISTYFLEVEGAFSTAQFVPWIQSKYSLCPGSNPSTVLALSTNISWP